MSLKKSFFVIVFLLVLAVSGYAQLGSSVGAVVTYNPLNPSYYSFGIMTSVGGYSGMEDNTGHFLRFGMTFGKLTVDYERNNPYSVNNTLTEYWQKSIYMELFIIGYAYQFGFSDTFAFRVGADWNFSFAPAYTPPNTSFIASSSALDGFNTGLMGIAGVVLFPKRPFSISLDACPGYQIDFFEKKFKEASDHQSLFGFIMPIRLTVNLTVGAKE